MNTAHQLETPPTPPPSAAVEVERPSVSLALAATLQRISSETGTPYFQVIREFAGLAFGPGRLSLDEYVALRLFDNRMYAGVDKKTFVGLDASRRIWLRANHRIEYFGLIDNKIAANALFAAHGFPTIPTLALYSGRTGGSAPGLLRDADQLRAFLRRGDGYPIFGKPIGGLQSLGSVSLERHDGERSRLIAVGGREIPLDAFVFEVQKHYGDGYLFQPRVAPHVAVRAMCGDRLATVRLLTTLSKGEPRLMRACWKIPAGANAADNFWRSGNLLGELELETGMVRRVVRGTGLALEELTHHPDTGAPIVGTRVPNWSDVTALALEGARILPQVALTGWDIAPVDNGALMVELNQSPDFLLPQLADRRGILDAAFMDFLAERRQAAADWKREKKQSVRRSSLGFHIGLNETKSV